MSDQHFPTENEGAKPGGNTGSVHGEVPLIRKKEELTPEQYKRQRNNLILMALLVVLIIAAFVAFPYIKAALLGGAAFLAPTRARGGEFCPGVLPHAHVVRRQAVSLVRQPWEDAPIAVQNCRACAPLPI